MEVLHPSPLGMNKLYEGVKILGGGDCRDSRYNSVGWAALIATVAIKRSTIVMGLSIAYIAIVYPLGVINIRR